MNSEMRIYQNREKNKADVKKRFIRNVEKTNGIGYM